ncbi:MAG: phosphotransferase [Acidimicrobiales bacterium]
MQLLVVEDEPGVAELLVEAARTRGVEINARVVTNRDDALLVVRSNDFFDLAVCDLRIPSTQGSLDEDSAFGREVYASLRETRPGMPICVYSGYADEDFLEGLVLEQRQGDPYGTGQLGPMVRPIKKLRMTDLVIELERVGSELRFLDRLEISTQGVDLGLALEEDRLLRLVTRRLGGTTGRIAELGQGMSGSRVVLLRAIDHYGGQIAQCVVKIGTRTDLEEEARRYEQHVPGSLTAACFAPVFATFREGAGGLVGLAYSAAMSNPRSLAAVLADDPAAACAAVARLQVIEQAWREGGHTVQLGLDEIGSLLSVGSDPIQLVAEMDEPLAERLRSRNVQVVRAVQHGDLHLGNALIGQSGEPVLIDYGRTGQKLVAYDPVTLELSLAFHPDGRGIAGGWPTTERASVFDDLDQYLSDCPFPAFVQHCRQWAFDVANGDREVYACVLSYAARQLKFDDTDHDLARAYIWRAATLLAG